MVLLAGVGMLCIPFNIFYVRCVVSIFEGFSQPFPSVSALVIVGRQIKYLYWYLRVGRTEKTGDEQT